MPAMTNMISPLFVVLGSVIRFANKIVKKYSKGMKTTNGLLTSVVSHFRAIHDGKHNCLLVCFQIINIK